VQRRWPAGCLRLQQVLRACWPGLGLGEAGLRGVLPGGAVCSAARACPCGERSGGVGGWMRRSGDCCLHGRRAGRRECAAPGR